MRIRDAAIISPYKTKPAYTMPLYSVDETNKKVSQIAYGMDTYNGTDEIVDCFASIQMTNDFAKPRLAEWAENPWFAKMIDERKSTCTYPESLQ